MYSLHIDSSGGVLREEGFLPVVEQCQSIGRRDELARAEVDGLLRRSVSCSRSSCSCIHAIGCLLRIKESQ